MQQDPHAAPAAGGDGGARFTRLDRVTSAYALVLGGEARQLIVVGDRSSGSPIWTFVLLDGIPDGSVPLYLNDERDPVPVCSGSFSLAQDGGPTTTQLDGDDVAAMVSALLLEGPAAQGVEIVYAKAGLNWQVAVPGPDGPLTMTIRLDILFIPPAWLPTVDRWRVLAAASAFVLRHRSG